jgi:DNA primase
LTTPPDKWTLLTVPQRLRRIKTDPWAGYWKTTQRLTDKLIKAVAAL